jgi:GNAT superfamily N-acetyltransferase
MIYELVKVSIPEEWAAYHRIRREELFEARGRVGVYNPDHADEFKPEHTPLLLKQNGVGVATTRLDIRDATTAIIRLVAVTKSLQGQGVGRELAQQTLALARARGIHRPVVNAAPTAVGYYERSGFKPDAWDPAELVGISSDSVQMSLDLA